MAIKKERVAFLSTAVLRAIQDLLISNDRQADGAGSSSDREPLRRFAGKGKKRPTEGHERALGVLQIKIGADS
jgi:hypothetical protein